MTHTPYLIIANKITFLISLTLRKHSSKPKARPLFRINIYRIVNKYCEFSSNRFGIAPVHIINLVKCNRSPDPRVRALAPRSRSLTRSENT